MSKQKADLTFRNLSQSSETAQIQYEVNNCADDTSAFVNLRVFLFISLDPMSAHYDERRQENGKCQGKEEFCQTHVSFEFKTLR